VPAAKAKPAAAKIAKKTPIGATGNLKPHPATAFPTPMAPMKLACRGADPRAMKAFIAAAISGADVKFVPMAKGAEGHGGSPIALAVGDDGALVLSEANAVARYLGAAKALAPAGAARWTAERWCEWEASTLAPAVAVACASNDGAPLQALLAGTLETHLASSGGGFIAGGDAPSLADIVLYSALFPCPRRGRRGGHQRRRDDGVQHRVLVREVRIHRSVRQGIGNREGVGDDGGVAVRAGRPRASPHRHG
jgi:hypothetical protein